MNTLGIVAIASALALWFAIALIVGYRLGWERGRRALSADILRANPRAPSMDLGNTVARHPRRG